MNSYTNPETIRYHLIERIGRGATGEVYLAEAERENPGAESERWPVAVKIIASERGGMPDAMSHGLLSYEAQKLKDLGNPRVVAPTDMVRLDQPYGSWAVVMDFVPGADLLRIKRHLADRGEPISPRAALQIASGALAALAAAHEVQGRPAIHRALTPADVRLSPSGDVTVVDFAVHRGPTGPFRPPEQRGQVPPAPSPQGDVYTAALIALWLVDGVEQLPSALEDARAIDERLHRLSPILGASLAARTASALLRVALAVREEERPKARALGEALSDVAKGISGEDLSAFAARVVPRASHPRPSEEGRARPIPPRVSASRVRNYAQNKAALGLIATSLLTLLTVLGILGALLWTWRDLPSPPTDEVSVPSP